MPIDDKTQQAFDNFVQLWTTGTTGGRRSSACTPRSPSSGSTSTSSDGERAEGLAIRLCADHDACIRSAARSSTEGKPSIDQMLTL